MRIFGWIVIISVFFLGFIDFTFWLRHQSINIAPITELEGLPGFRKTQISDAKIQLANAKFFRKNNGELSEAYLPIFSADDPEGPIMALSHTSNPQTLSKLSQLNSSTKENQIPNDLEVKLLTGWIRKKVSPKELSIINSFQNKTDNVVTLRSDIAPPSIKFFVTCFALGFIFLVVHFRDLKRKRSQTSTSLPDPEKSKIGIPSLEKIIASEINANNIICEQSIDKYREKSSTYTHKDQSFWIFEDENGHLKVWGNYKNEILMESYSTPGLSGTVTKFENSLVYIDVADPASGNKLFSMASQSALPWYKNLEDVKGQQLILSITITAEHLVKIDSKTISELDPTGKFLEYSVASLGLASESLTPSKILITGDVLLCTPAVDPISKTEFYAMRVRSKGGEFNIAAAKNLVDGQDIKRTDQIAIQGSSCASFCEFLPQ